MLTRPAFVFPGQGSQYPGMYRDLTACGAVARRLVDDATVATGLDLTALMTTADAETIAQSLATSGRGWSGSSGASAAARPAGSPSNGADRCWTRLTW